MIVFFTICNFCQRTLLHLIYFYVQFALVKISESRNESIFYLVSTPKYYEEYQDKKNLSDCLFLSFWAHPLYLSYYIILYELVN